MPAVDAAVVAEVDRPLGDDADGVAALDGGRDLWPRPTPWAASCTVTVRRAVAGTVSVVVRGAAPRR